MKLTIGEHQLTATIENNTSAQAIKRMPEHNPKTIQMRDYGGMEPPNACYAVNL